MQLTRHTRHSSSTWEAYLRRTASSARDSSASSCAITGFPERFPPPVRAWPPALVIQQRMNQRLAEQLTQLPRHEDEPGPAASASTRPRAASRTKQTSATTRGTAAAAV